MTEFLFDPDDNYARHAPEYLRERAMAQNKKILKIVWDRAGEYPEHAWGVIQWSVRPYEQRYGCDGTTDLNIHLIALRLCQFLGLDYPTLYEQAYAWRDEKDTWVREWASSDLSQIEGQTIIPELSEESVNRSFA